MSKERGKFAATGFGIGLGRKGAVVVEVAGYRNGG